LHERLNPVRGGPDTEPGERLNVGDPLVFARTCFLVVHGLVAPSLLVTLVERGRLHLILIGEVVVVDIRSVVRKHRVTARIEESRRDIRREYLALPLVNWLGRSVSARHRGARGPSSLHTTTEAATVITAATLVVVKHSIVAPMVTWRRHRVSALSSRAIVAVPGEVVATSVVPARIDMVPTRWSI
jgi:hypothetical protein